MEVGGQEVHKLMISLIVTVQLSMTVTPIWPEGSGVNTLDLMCQIELSVHSVKHSTCAMVHDRQTLARPQDREGKRQKLVDESAGAYICAPSDGGSSFAVTASTTEEPIKPTVCTNPYHPVCGACS